jgi:hypothetical protein
LLQAIDSQFDIVAAFWHPKSKKGGFAKKASYEGTLNADDHSIRFTTAPKYGSVVSRNSSKDLKRYTAWHGLTPEGPCTLCKVVEFDEAGVRNMSLKRAVLAKVYYASVCIFGMHLGGLEDKCIDYARYSFKGLNEWFRTNAHCTWNPLGWIVGYASLCCVFDRDEIKVTQWPRCV